MSIRACDEQELICRYVGETSNDLISDIRSARAGDEESSGSNLVPKGDALAERETIAGRQTVLSHCDLIS